MEPIPSTHVILGDFTNEQTQQLIMKCLDGKKADVLLSDMAPFASGHRDSDHLSLISLNELAISFADIVLKNGGTLLIKSSRGGQGNLL